MKTQKVIQKIKAAKKQDVISALLTNHYSLIKLKLQPQSNDATLDWSWYYAS